MSVYLFYQMQCLDVYTKELYVHVYEINRRLCVCVYVDRDARIGIDDGEGKKTANERDEGMKF